MKYSKIIFAGAALLSVVSTTTGAMAASKDATWIKSAISANMLEIKAGSLAAHRSTEKALQKFGTMMVQDHTTALGGLKSLAKDKGMMVSSKLAPPDAAAYSMLSRKHGKAFDAAYTQFAVASHVAANSLYSKEVAGGRDSDARAVAAKQLPTVQNHLTMADKMTGMSMKNLSKGTGK